MRPSFKYQRLTGADKSPGHYYQATATFRPAIRVPAFFLKADTRQWNALADRIYRACRPAGRFISRFGAKSGVKTWHLILECRVVTSIPEGSRPKAYAESLREAAVVISAQTKPRGRFKEFFLASLDEAVAQSGLLGDSAIFLFIYTITVRAYL